jgi:hypothetical protein
MSQDAVAAALGTWFGGTLQTDPDGGQRRYTGGPIDGLNTLYIGMPAHFPQSYFFQGQPSGTKNGAIAVVRMEDPEEERMSYGGVGAWWRVAHPVILHVYHLSRATHAEDARADLRRIQDAIRDQLRMDTTLGGLVFSAGEHDTVAGGATGSGHKWKTTGTATAGGQHETRSDWSLTVVEHVQSGGS